MAKPIVYITRRIPEQAFSVLEHTYEVRMWPKADEAVPRQVLLDEVRQATALVTMITEQIDDEVFAAAEQLQIVANVAVGYDNVDVAAARRHQVIVTNTPDVLNDTTADLAFALLMATARHIVSTAEQIKNDQWGLWHPLQPAGKDIHHKTLGIVGMGRIGETVAKRAQGFDMTVLYHNRHRKPEAERQWGAQYADFNELLAAADFVLCLAPLNDETKHMFARKAFQKMKSDAMFINVARGGLVNEADLMAAIERKDIAGAGLDVYQNEPISSRHPLLAYDNVVALPHIGSASVETRMAMLRLACDNVYDVLQGGEARTPI